MKRQNWKLREIYSLSDEDLLQFMEELGSGSDSDFKLYGLDYLAREQLKKSLWNEAMCRGIHPKGQFDDWVQAEREWNRGVTDPRQNLLHRQGLEGSIEDYVRYKKRRGKFLARQERMSKMSKTDPTKPLRLIRVREEETKPMGEK
jgi:hypothetical protein